MILVYFTQENHRKIFAQSIETINDDYACYGGDTIEDGLLWVNYSMESCHDFTGPAGNDNDFFKYLSSMNVAVGGIFIDETSNRRVSKSNL